MKKTHIRRIGVGIVASFCLGQTAVQGASLDEYNTIVDVSFSWTQERQNNYGGRNQVLANMNQSLGITNRAHDNSDTGIFFNYIMNGGALNYNPPSNNNSVISSLRDGRVPGTVNRRNQKGADVMALNSQMAAAGLAFRGDPRQYAVRYLTGTTSAHELGHTFGCGHGGIGSSYSDGQGDRPYAAGWAYRDGNNVRRGTIMTGAQIMWYSTPNKTFNGQRTGIANVKDSTRRIRETRRESSRIRNLKPQTGNDGAGGWWYVTNRFSNRRMSLLSTNRNNGTRISQRSGSSDSFQWRFDDAGLGNRTLTTRNRYSNKALDMTGNTRPGQYVHQWSHNPSNRNQQFRFVYDSSGIMKIRFNNGNNYLENPFRRTGNNTPLGQWSGAGSTHQQWYLQRVN